MRLVAFTAVDVVNVGTAHVSCWKDGIGTGRFQFLGVFLPPTPSGPWSAQRCGLFVNYGNQKTKTVDSRDSVSQSVPSLLQIDANFKLRVFLSHIWILGSADLCCTHTSLSCDPSVRNLHRTGMNEKYLHLFVRNYRSRFYSYFSPRNWCSAHCGIRCNVIGFFSDWNSWLERKIENLWIDRTNSKAM